VEHRWQSSLGKRGTGEMQRKVRKIPNGDIRGVGDNLGGRREMGEEKLVRIKMDSPDVCGVTLGSEYSG